METEPKTPELWPVTVDWELGFCRPQTQKALAYWQSLCRGRRMPARRELDPCAMKEFIPYVNLVDVVRREAGAYEYVVTLQSNRARDMLGNVENRRLPDILPPATEEHWRSSFDLPRAKVAPVRLTTRSNTPGEHGFAHEILLAPLGPAEEVQAIYWVIA